MISSATLNDGLASKWYQWLYPFILLVGLLAGYELFKSLRWNQLVRRKYGDIPHIPRHWFFGHLISMGEKLNPKINRHPDYAFEDVWNELGQPPAYLFDVALIDRAMLIIADPTVAEAIAQPSADWKYSTPKSDTMKPMNKLVGKQSLVIIEGEAWRTQRRRFNKGFSPAHLNTLTPMIVEKTRIFLDRIKSHASDGQPFAFKGTAQDLTTDVITQLTIEKDFQAQTTPEGTGAKSRFGFLTTLKTMSSLTEKVGQGFDPASFLPQRRIKEFFYDKLYTRALYKEIITKLPTSQKSASAKDATSAPLSAKAIVHLSLAGLDPTTAVLNSTVDQIKTFLFAGQDTTSTTIQWMAYELSKSYPSSPVYTDHARRVRERLCTEHDAVFGTDPFGVLDLLDDPNVNIEETLGVKLPYTTAFVKETLRLYPPAGSARLAPMAPYDRWPLSDVEAKPFYLDLPAWTHSKTGERHEARRVRADGLRFYNCHYLVGRNPQIWGDDAGVFNPARFLDLNVNGKPVNELEEANNTAATQKPSSAQLGDKGALPLPHPCHISTLPVGSYRPFERGPRTCIGSNLAMMEAKIVLAVIARGFEWTKVGLNGRPDGYKRAVEDKAIGEAKNWEVWNINNVTAVPVDGMMMKVKLRQSQSKAG